MNKMMSPAALNAEDAAAFSVRGFISSRRRKPNDDLVDELCIARTREGRTLLRLLRKGRKPGTWDLVSITGDPLLDQELEWAERVIWLEPHRITHTEIDALQEVESVE
ncbi:hypothetical protein GOC31_20780 [Sinorhizobium meliloti]|nr:hypothetical protein [Sinorhizobium meliloti]